MGCVNPPLAAKPSRGYGWTCATCSRKHEEEVDAHGASRNDTPPTAKAHDKPKKVVEVNRPNVWSHTRWAVKLPEFRAPHDLIDAAFGRNPSAAIQPFIPAFDLEHYGQFWQALVWIEEEKMQ